MRFKVFQIRRAESKSDGHNRYIYASSMSRAINAVYDKYKMSTGLIFPYDVKCLNDLTMCELSDVKRKFFIKEITDAAMICELERIHKIMPVSEYE